MIKIALRLRSVDMDENKQPSNTDIYATRKTLIQRVQDQHNDEAWAELFSIYSRYVYSILISMNVSASDADELHQEIMIKIWKRLPELDVQELRFRNYLSTVTKNTVLNFIRSRKRRIDREEKALGDSTISYLDSIRLPDIEEIAEKEWRVYLTHLALQNIEQLFSQNAITVFKLSLQGLTAQQISEQENMTFSTVNTLKSRVKSRFKIELQQLKEELE
ncbi:RNA polymerase sigma factor [Pontiella sulfatireligans]|nr:sigma-70 family RNA polymerase sigma factor [Pontiella sulfatireligans]